MSKQETIDIPDLAGALERAAGNTSVAFDVEKYQVYLDDPALSAEQKEELLRALWTIISAFVELGFGVHPIQQACGQVEKEYDAGRLPESDVLISGNIELTDDFNDGPVDD